MYKNNKPVYVALEGLDGTGKSTLFQHLTARLQQAQVSFSTLCPTRMTRPRSIVERVFNFSRFNKSIPLLRRIIFAYRSYSASRLTDHNSALILGDRSIAGSYAKNWKIIFNSRRLTILLFDIIEPFVPAPDYILLLRASPANIAERLKPRAYVDVDEVPHVQERMRQAYNEMMQGRTANRLRHTKWIIVDANKPEDELADEVFLLIQQLVPHR